MSPVDNSVIGPVQPPATPISTKHTKENPISSEWPRARSTVPQTRRAPRRTMHSFPFIPRPFPPPALADVPIEYIIDQLHSLAPHYWSKPETADCTVGESRCDVVQSLLLLLIRFVKLFLYRTKLLAQRQLTHKLLTTSMDLSQTFPQKKGPGMLADQWILPFVQRLV